MENVLIALILAISAQGPAASEKKDVMVTVRQFVDNFTLNTPRHVVITDNRAYVVVPANYTYKQKGKLVRQIGSIYTLTLKKGSSGWRITGGAWAKR